MVRHICICEIMDNWLLNWYNAGANLCHSMTASVIQHKHMHIYSLMILGRYQEIMVPVNERST